MGASEQGSSARERGSEAAERASRASELRPEAAELRPEAAELRPEAAEPRTEAAELSTEAAELHAKAAELPAEAGEPRLRAIALLGLRGAGKTSVGRALATLLERDFVDLDEELVRVHVERELAAASPRAARADAHERRRDERASLPRAGELLGTLGEPAFRALECEALARVLARSTSDALGSSGPRGLVLATGGGVVERAENRALLARAATCVWLRVPASELRRRLAADPTPRPALLGGDPLAEIEELARRREPHYGALAQIVLDAGAAPPDELARRLAARLRV